MVRFAIVCSVVFLLIGCDPVQEGTEAFESVKDVKGQVGDAIQMGKSMTDGITDMIQDAKKRINQVQSGVDLLMRGKEMIESGVSGTQ